MRSSIRVSSLRPSLALWPSCWRRGCATQGLQEARQDHPGAAHPAQGGPLREGQGPDRQEEVRGRPQVPEPRLRDLPQRDHRAARPCCWWPTRTSSRRAPPSYTEARYRYRDYLNRYPGRAPARLRALPVRPLLRQGAREAGPGPDGDPGGDRAVPGPDPRVPGLGLRRGGPRADPPAHRPARGARLRGRLLLPAQGLHGGRPVALHDPRAAVSGLRRPRTSSSTTRPRRSSGWGARTRRALLRAGSWRSFPRAVRQEGELPHGRQKRRKSPRRRPQRLTQSPKASNF